MREVVIDTETTGLNYASGDRIIEVGCVEVINYVPSGNKLGFYCKVDKQISEDAKKISGITNQFLADKKTFEDQHEEFLNFIKEDTLVIHNASFDTGFINNELKIIGKEKLKNKIIDTVVLARKVLNTRIANLDYLCRHFDIDLSKRKQHGALLDAQLLAEVYLELKGGKQISMDLTSKNNLKKESFKKNEQFNKTSQKINISEEEINSHKVLVKKIKNPIWNNYDY